MINKKRIEKFLEVYNKLEKILLESTSVQQSTVLEFENSIAGCNEAVFQKLKLCRIMRNYIQHNDREFVEPSLEMIKFLEQTIQSISDKNKKVKDVMKKVTPLYTSDKITDVAKRLLRSEKIPVVSKKSRQPVGFVTDKIVSNSLATRKHNKKISDNLSKVFTAQYVAKDTSVEDVSGFAIVTDNGKSTGKFLGVVNHK